MPFGLAAFCPVSCAIHRVHMSALEAFIRRVAAPSLRLKEGDCQLVAKLCETLKAFWADRRDRWLRAHSDQPILEAYACEGTPLTIRQRYRHETAEGDVTRSGDSFTYWIVQRCSLRASSFDACVLFTEPRVLYDKIG